MSLRDGHEWYPIKWNDICICEEDGCQEAARWEKMLYACNKSCYSGGNYCQKHASEDGAPEAKCKPKLRKLRCLPVNTEFVIDGRKYVRVPGMNLHCDTWDFYINVLRVESQGDKYTSPVFVVDFLLPETEVEVIVPKQTSASVRQFDEITDQEEDKYAILFDAAIEAVEHVAQANWNGREKAAKIYLSRIFDRIARGLEIDDEKSLGFIQEEVNSEGERFEE